MKFVHKLIGKRILSYIIKAGRSEYGIFLYFLSGQKVVENPGYHQKRICHFQKW